MRAVVPQAWGPGRPPRDLAEALYAVSGDVQSSLDMDPVNIGLDPPEASGQVRKKQPFGLGPQQPASIIAYLSLSQRLADNSAACPCRLGLALPYT